MTVWQLLMQMIRSDQAVLREIRILRDEVSSLKILIAENLEISKRIEQQVIPDPADQASNIEVRIGEPRDKS